ncbi:MAG TPA: ABC transporter permease [Minicystis sp.]|nr:ABC transporter permease [Minicystis sp.]
MSAQTGIAPPSGPVSRRAVDRARYRVDRLRAEPNPVWIRELKQSARLGRTPILLMALTIVTTLVVAAIGGLVSVETSPATTGIVLFHVFFSLAWFVVTLVGPAVAANSIASEREGHTWEAVVLTGLPPERIARGKFLAAFTGIGAYVVALAPVGALSFLFGGITATEVVVAFAFLFLIALLSVAFGLALSSKMDRVRAAILATLLLSFPMSLLSYVVFGVGLSVAAHRLWPGVIEGAPVWLPTAYDRAGFDLTYVVCLFVLPVIAVTLPAWFLYEVTVANLTSITDDRSSGLKRWFLVTTPVLAATAAAAPFLAARSDRLAFATAGASILVVFLTFAVFLFQGDPIGPSRRVVVQWELARASRARRFLGPGVLRSATLLLVVGGGALFAVLCAGAAALGVGSFKAVVLQELGAFGAYALAFGVFVVGLGAFLRARIPSPITARVITLAILFGVAAGPWIAAAILGIAVGHASRDAFCIAAPSPLFAFYMQDAIARGQAGAALPAGLGCAVAWAGLGLVLLGGAQRRAKKIIREHEAMLAETDRILAEEDARRAAAEADGPGDAAAPAIAEEAPA